MISKDISDQKSEGVSNNKLLRGKASGAPQATPCLLHEVLSSQLITTAHTAALCCNPECGNARAPCTINQCGHRRFISLISRCGGDCHLLQPGSGHHGVE